MNDGLGTSRQPEWEKTTETVIGCAFRVANTLGPGFLEKVYENALAHEVRKAGLKAVKQAEVDVMYDGVKVGRYVADLLIEETVVVEVKAAKIVDNAHIAQCINYLKATGRPVCLLLNFGTARIGLRRVLNPSVQEGWMHSADHVCFEPDCDDPDPPNVASADSAPSEILSPIRVHPCSSVAPNP